MNAEFAAVVPHPAAGVMLARCRAAHWNELDSIPWLHTMDADERGRVVAELRAVKIEPGALVCRFGRPVIYWFGVIVP